MGAASDALIGLIEDGVPVDWNPRAAKRYREARARERYNEARAREDWAVMAAGPRLEGQWLVIPSRWYHPDAVRFYRALGAHYNEREPEGRAWILDTRRAHWRGKRYGRWVWLRSVRRKFYEFWDMVDLYDGKEKND